MAEFVTVAKVSEVEPGQLKHIELDTDTQICLANVDGTFYAIGGECTHEGGLLGEGELDGTTVICPLHSGEFDVTNGEVQASPPFEPATTYEVRIEGDDVQVSTG